VGLHLVPLLARRDDRERGGGGRLARERRRDGGGGGGQRRAEEGLGREGEAGCGEPPGPGARGDGEGRGAREGEGQRHGFSRLSLPLREFVACGFWIGCGRMARMDKQSSEPLGAAGRLPNGRPTELEAACAAAHWARAELVD